MTVTYTSLEAYRNHVLNGKCKTQRDIIFQWLCKYSTTKKGYTRNEISEYLKIRLSAVCGRVSQLIFDGYCEEIGEREDAFTKINSKVVIAKLPHKAKSQMTLRM